MSNSLSAALVTETVIGNGTETVTEKETEIMTGTRKETEENGIGIEETVTRTGRETEEKVDALDVEEITGSLRNEGMATAENVLVPAHALDVGQPRHVGAPGDPVLALAPGHVRLAVVPGAAVIARPQNLLRVLWVVL
ncbi:hypothetical protein PM082_007676 [Marasmius tenuissimus]|nr:hypothetical protein PM082_007676 [Marasmius tenuissimus]